MFRTSLSLYLFYTPFIGTCQYLFHIYLLILHRYHIDFTFFLCILVFNFLHFYVFSLFLIGTFKYFPLFSFYRQIPYKTAFETETPKNLKRQKKTAK
ncbi:hypothetical protein CLOSTHATH_02781 [Hungatella hathewayi DSM 13479]|uniref:Uncharacterized protein n=1 Tax=Hungatella hathewayi DSM 13479 TaxID=566550 RepID=D3AGP6_9FIRM|nr:hypothetical protein CLOSTHATH_02781 [Hungatella hathewayi DSM 13479]